MNNTCNIKKLLDRKMKEVDNLYNSTWKSAVYSANKNYTAKRYNTNKTNNQESKLRKEVLDIIKFYVDEEDCSDEVLYEVTKAFEKYEK